MSHHSVSISLAVDVGKNANPIAIDKSESLTQPIRNRCTRNTFPRVRQQLLRGDTHTKSRQVKEKEETQSENEIKSVRNSLIDTSRVGCKTLMRHLLIIRLTRSALLAYSFEADAATRVTSFPHGGGEASIQKSRRLFHFCLFFFSHTYSFSPHIKTAKPN